MTGDAFNAITTATWWTLLTLGLWPSLLWTLTLTLGTDLTRTLTERGRR